MPRPDSQTRRDRAHGQPAGAQGRRRRGGHRRSGRDADLSSEVFAGPQPDRIGLQQTQGASAQGGRAYDLAPLASDRSRRYRYHRTRMLQLFPTCRIRFYMTGIGSNIWNEMFHAKGGNEFVGRSLGSLLRFAGVENVQVKVQAEVALVGEYRRTHLLSLLDSMRDAVLAAGL